MHVRERAMRCRDLAERIQLQFVDRCAVCPSCGHRMELDRVIPMGPYVAEQLIFQCHDCQIAMTRAGCEPTD
jgi:hypothetical protein